MEKFILNEVEFCKNIDAMIKEEEEAVEMYQKYGLNFIAGQEKEHAEILKSLKMEYCDG